MQSTTGDIATAEELAQLDEILRKTYDVPLTKKEARDLKKIKPKSRIPFATMTKNQRKAFRKKIRQGKI